MLRQRLLVPLLLSLAVIVAGSVYIIHTLHGNSLLEIIVLYSAAIIEKIGYLGIFILMTLESALVPIPSEIVMPFAGFLVWSGKMDLTLVVLSGTLGNLVGSFILYKLGEGPGLKFIEKYGKYFMIGEPEVAQAQQLFSRYGSLIIFTGRMLPAVRTVISLPAGISRMNLPKFLAYTFLGSVPWNLALTYVGLVLGEHWVVIEKYARVLDYVVIVLAIIAVLAFYIYKTRNRKEYQRS